MTFPVPGSSWSILKTWFWRFERGGLIFVFNFHPTISHNDYGIEARQGEYQMIMDSDALEYGGHGRLQRDQRHFTATALSLPALSLYLPTRTALVLASVDNGH